MKLEALEHPTPDKLDYNGMFVICLYCVFKV